MSEMRVRPPAILRLCLARCIGFVAISFCTLSEEAPLVAQSRDEAFRRSQELEAQAAKDKSKAGEVKLVTAEPGGRILDAGTVPRNELPKQVPGVAVPWRKSQSPREEDLRCGVKALFAFLRMHDVPVSLAELEEELTVGEKGIDMLQLKNVARSYGLIARVVKCSPTDLRAALPAIVRTSPGSGSDVAHYLVIARLSDKDVGYVEPTSCRFENASSVAFSRYFAGHALVADTRGKWAPLVSFLLGVIAAGQVMAIVAMWWRSH